MPPNREPSGGIPVQDTREKRRRKPSRPRLLLIPRERLGMCLGQFRATFTTRNYLMILELRFPTAPRATWHILEPTSPFPISHPSYTLLTKNKPFFNFGEKNTGFYKKIFFPFLKTFLFSAKKKKGFCFWFKAC